MDPEEQAKFRAGPALCPHADTCPGCPLLDLSYPDQLTHKRAQVQAELSGYPELRALALAATQAAPRALRYRTRAKLVASGPVLGLYARGTHQPVDLPHCQVLDATVAEVVAALRGLLPEAPLLSGVDVTRVGARILVTLIAREDAEQSALLALAAQLRARCPEVAGVASTRRASSAVQLLAGGHVLLLGDRELRAQSEDAGPYHYVAPGAFVQAHEEVARSIYAELCSRVFAAGAVRPRVLELYAGSGALALALAARGAEVVAVESYGPACERMSRAAREQRLSLRVLHGDAGQQLRCLRAQGAKFDVVLVNPPRRGLTPEVRREVSALRPAALGYVSCRPSTLSRDLAHFARLSLVPERALPFDMMPMTEQVETLVWLTPGAAPHCATLAESAQILILDKPPFLSMAELSAQARMRAGFEAAVPLVALSPEASGAVAFARDPSVQAAAHPTAARHTFCVLAKGVLRARGKVRVKSGSVLSYVRERVIAGHSLLRVQANDELSVRRGLAALQHPVLGDPRSDRESARYFAQRHGLDRCFLHLTELGVATQSDEDEPAGPTSVLAPDLAAVLRSLSERVDASALLPDA